LLTDLCTEQPDMQDGLWTCPDNKFRREVDFVLLSVGGNDIGFSSLVGWATLRGRASSTIAKFFGATVSAKQFGRNMQEILPRAYATLAKVLETRVPVKAGEIGFDPSHIVITAYPDILADETGQVCAAGVEDEDESAFAANQSLDVFSSWLVVTQKRLASAHEKLADLQTRIGALAEDHGWTFAGRAYGDAAFRGHGFCARNPARQTDPVEVLRMPCWSKPGSSAATCESSFSGGERVWQPYDPGSQNFPYALRQRWVRTFNDVYMVVNQKVLTREGRIDDRASAASFSETTGAMHPSAEGHAAMADAMLLDLRRLVKEVVE
jgi:lysophospholipase L1-like esterase